MRETVRNHEGSKYLRKIYPADGVGEPIWVDAYCVFKAFGVDSIPIAHAIKKLLAPGQRGKGNARADLVGALAAINRAIDQLDESVEEKKEIPPVTDTWTVHVEVPTPSDRETEWEGEAGNALEQAMKERYGDGNKGVIDAGKASTASIPVVKQSRAKDKPKTKARSKKITESDVREIRWRHDDRLETCAQIARVMRLSYSSVNDIINKRTHKNVK